MTATPQGIETYRIRKQKAEGRLDRARAAAHDGLSLLDFAEQEGVSRPSIISYLDRCGEDGVSVRQALRDNSTFGGLRHTERAKRLVALLHCRTLSEAGSLFGVSKAAMSLFRKRNVDDEDVAFALGDLCERNRAAGEAALAFIDKYARRLPGGGAQARRIVTAALGVAQEEAAGA